MESEGVYLMKFSKGNMVLTGVIALLGLAHAPQASAAEANCMCECDASYGGLKQFTVSDSKACSSKEGDSCTGSSGKSGKLKDCSFWSAASS